MWAERECLPNDAISALSLCNGHCFQIFHIWFMKLANQPVSTVSAVEAFLVWTDLTPGWDTSQRKIYPLSWLLWLWKEIRSAWTMHLLFWIGLLLRKRNAFEFFSDQVLVIGHAMEVSIEFIATFFPIKTNFHVLKTLTTSYIKLIWKDSIQRLNQS